jgi:hypothetical protein
LGPAGDRGQAAHARTRIAITSVWKKLRCGAATVEGLATISSGVVSSMWTATSFFVSMVGAPW